MPTSFDPHPISTIPQASTSAASPLTLSRVPEGSLFSRTACTNHSATRFFSFGLGHNTTSMRKQSTVILFLLYPIFSFPPFSSVEFVPARPC